MNADHFTYRVTCLPEDGEHIGLCAEFPSLSWLAETPEAALLGIRQVVADVIEDLRASGTLPLTVAKYLPPPSWGRVGVRG